MRILVTAATVLVIQCHVYLVVSNNDRYDAAKALLFCLCADGLLSVVAAAFWVSFDTELSGTALS